MKIKNWKIDFSGVITFGKKIKTFYILPLIEYSVCPIYDDADMNLIPGKSYEVRIGWLCAVFSICAEKER